MTIRNQRAFAAGLLFLIVAATFLVLSSDLEAGTAARMGPGYFPWLLSLVLGAIGLVVMAGAMSARATVERLARWDWKGLAWVTGSVVLFGLVLQPLGMVLALLVLVLVSSRASPEFTWRGSLAAAIILIAICVGAFDYGIDLRIPLWPAMLD